MVYDTQKVNILNLNQGKELNLDIFRHEGGIRCLITFIILEFLLCGCTNGTIKKNKEVRFALISGGYAIVPCFIDEFGDTIYDGIARYYSRDKILTDEVSFKNSQKNGWHIRYKQGKVLSKIMYQDNLANGDGFFYWDSGIIEQKVFYKDRKEVCIESYDSAGKLSSISFFDNENPFYIALYDKGGRIKKENGVVFSHSFESNQKYDSVKVNSEFELIIPVVNLPNYWINVEIVKFSPSNEIYDATDSVPIKGYFAFYKTRFERIGLQQLGIAGELRNDEGSLIRRDTFYQKINVIE